MTMAFDSSCFTYSFPIECDDFENLSDLAQISPSTFKQELASFPSSDLLMYYAVITIELISLLRESPEFLVSNERQKINRNISVLENVIISRMDGTSNAKSEKVTTFPQGVNKSSFHC